MHDKWYQIFGMAGFIIAGLLFIMTGIKHADMLTVTGSVVWTISCIVMLIPLLSR